MNTSSTGNPLHLTNHRQFCHGIPASHICIAYVCMCLCYIMWDSCVFSHQHLMYTTEGLLWIPTLTRALSTTHWNVRSPGWTEVFTLLGKGMCSRNLLKTEQVSDLSLCIPLMGPGVWNSLRTWMPFWGPWMRSVWTHVCVPTPTPLPNRRILKAHTDHCQCSKPLSLPLLLLLNTTHKTKHDPSSCQFLDKDDWFPSSLHWPQESAHHPQRWPCWDLKLQSTEESMLSPVWVRLSHKHQLNPPTVSHFKSEFLLVALCRAIFQIPALLRPPVDHWARRIPWTL